MTPGALEEVAACKVVVQTADERNIAPLVSTRAGDAVGSSVVKIQVGVLHIGGTVLTIGRGRVVVAQLIGVAEHGTDVVVAEGAVVVQEELIQLIQGAGVGLGELLGLRA